jgi:antitoxin (DNA-binding transcriptional repressor) of toxin-antitoxin stability system
LRNSAAYYFDQVAAGETFDVVRRGRLVAQIVPTSDSGRSELQTPPMTPPSITGSQTPTKQTQRLDVDA